MTRGVSQAEFDANSPRNARSGRVARCWGYLGVRRERLQEP